MSPKSRRSSARVAEVVILTTAMLSFISFWRAGAIVLCDMASTAYYIGGIAEQAIGRSAPWFVLAVMAFSACMLAVYVEASSMFVRGGVYKVVREAMGPTLAKVSVSALIFDYVLTGPISSVSAGHYLAGLLNSWFPVLKIGWQVRPDLFAAGFGILVTAYFWRRNILGIEESSDDAVRIIQMTSVMALVVFGWSAYTLYVRGFQWPPFTLRFGPETLGWLERFGWAKTMGAVGIAVGIGHAFLGMSGLESLAQVYREMDAPKLTNLKRAAVFIFLFAFLLTGLSTFFAATIIPDAARAKVLDNLLSGLTMSLEGDQRYLLILQAFVVFVGALILAGAVNTSLVGANGVLNRIAEDGILADWFRVLHPVHGTTHRMIHLVALLQVATILLSRGDVYLLGEAYAFGVIWSFVFKTASLVVLRFKDREERDWMVPLNLRWGGRRAEPRPGSTEEAWETRPIELPIGLSLIFLVVLVVAVTNLLTKKVATVWGVAFTAAFYALVQLSERVNRRRAERHGEHREKVNLNYKEDLAATVAELEHPNRVLVAVRDPKNMYPLESVLEVSDPKTTDIVVLHAKRAKGLHLGGEVTGMGPEEERLFTNVIEAAERHGKPVVPVMVVSNDPAYAVAQAAHAVNATEIVMGSSSIVDAEAMMERLSMSWGALGQAVAHEVKLRVVEPGGREHSCPLT